MAAARSALARLSRRSRVSSPPSAAAPGTPPLRPAAVGNLETWQCFSTEGRNRADSVLNMLGKWSKDCMRNVRKAGSAKALFVSTVIVSTASLSFTLANIWSLKQDIDARANGGGEH